MLAKNEGLARTWGIIVNAVFDPVDRSFAASADLLIPLHICGDNVGVASAQQVVAVERAGVGWDSFWLDIAGGKGKAAVVGICWLVHYCAALAYLHNRLWVLVWTTLGIHIIHLTLATCSTYSQEDRGGDLRFQIPVVIQGEVSNICGGVVHVVLIGRDVWEDEQAIQLIMPDISYYKCPQLQQKRRLDFVNQIGQCWIGSDAFSPQNTGIHNVSTQFPTECHVYGCEHEV